MTARLGNDVLAGTISGSTVSRRTVSAGAVARRAVRGYANVSVTVRVAGKTGAWNSIAVADVPHCGKAGMSAASVTAAQHASGATMAMTIAAAHARGAPAAMCPGQAAKQTDESRRDDESDQVSAHAWLSNLARLARQRPPVRGRRRSE
jgi:hypothetical protein